MTSHSQSPSNVRSLIKIFEKIYFFKLDFYFKMICITESWCFNNLHINNINQMLDYVSIHQVRENCKTSDGIKIFIHKDLIYKKRHDLSDKNDNASALCLQIINQESKNIFINTIYRQPSINENNFKNYYGKSVD